MTNRSRLALVLSLGLAGGAAHAAAPPAPTVKAPAGSCCRKDAKTGATSCTHAKAGAHDAAKCDHHEADAKTAARAKAAGCPRFAKAAAAKAAFACPMHPEVTSGEKGRCPKCGMFLEKTDKAS